MIDYCISCNSLFPAEELCFIYFCRGCRSEYVKTPALPSNEGDKMNSEKRTDSIFVVRPGETVFVSKGLPEEPDTFDLAVCLLSTPWLEPMVDGDRKLAVALAMHWDGEWRWQHLAPKSKRIVGDELVSRGAQPGEWWTLILQGEVA